jgi:8-amino-7-oxononanoate synthase
VDAQGLQERITVQMGTLGKALGTFGAFVAARRVVIDLLINTARSLVYTTALPPPVVAAASAALTIVEREPERRHRLAENARALHQDLAHLGLRVDAPPGHIIPVVIGDAGRTMQLSERLFAEGVFVPGIRPPTVPPGTARLRVTTMSTHTPQDIEFAANAFRRALSLE